MHYKRASSFQRSFRRSNSLTKPTHLALLGPGDTFGDEFCGLPCLDAGPRFVAVAYVLAVLAQSRHLSAFYAFFTIIMLMTDYSY